MERISVIPYFPFFRYCCCVCCFFCCWFDFFFILLWFIVAINQPVSVYTNYWYFFYEDSNVCEHEWIYFNISITLQDDRIKNVEYWIPLSTMEKLVRWWYHLLGLTFGQNHEHLTALHVDLCPARNFPVPFDHTLSPYLMWELILVVIAISHGNIPQQTVYAARIPSLGTDILWKIWWLTFRGCPT